MAVATRTTVRSRLTRLQALAVAAALAIGLAVLPSAAAPAQAAPPPGQGAVTVTITADDTGEPLENAWVQLTADDPDGFLFQGYTDASGTATVDADPGRYRIWASWGDYAETYFPGVFLLADAQVITVVEGETQVRAMPLMVGGSATITATFAGAAPEQEVMVDLVRRQSDGTFDYVPNIGCSTGASDNRCDIAGIPPGDYRAIASIGSWTPGYGQWMPGVWPSRTATVAIADGQHVAGTVTLAASTAITGDVVLDFASGAIEVDLQVRAVYLDGMPQEPTMPAELMVPVGGSVPFSLQVEPGRAFRLQLEARLGNTSADDKVIVTEQWTASGMALVGTPITVAAGEARHFTLAGHPGARFGGDYTIWGQGAPPSALRADCESCGDPVVELYRQVGGTWVLVDDHRWGQEGVFDLFQQFWFSGVAPGTYTLGFWADTVCREYWRDSETLAGATSFQVTMAGISGELRADLQPTSSGCVQPTPDPDPDPGPGPGPGPDPDPDPGPGPDPDPGPGPGSLPVPDRLAGANRFATSVAISQRTFTGTAPVVYLASGTSFPDGLAAGPAAAHEGGPVLLTPRDAVPQVVLNEIARLNPSRVVIVGGTPSVSANAAQQVAAIVGSSAITRLGGTNRFETSRLIADYAFPAGAPAAFVATGLRFPDALTAGPAAALRGGPVLLVRGNEAAPDAATLQTLRDLGANWVGVAGDANSVSAGIAAGIDAAVPAVQRFAGGNRFETAALIGGLFPTANSVMVASGLGFADALPGAAAAGAVGAPMLLARPTCVPAPTLTALHGWMPSEVLLLGGTPTLGAAVEGYTSC